MPFLAALWIKTQEQHSPRAWWKAYSRIYMYNVQWNLSIVDTTGPMKCVLIMLFQRLISKVCYWDLRNCPD